MCEGSQGNIIDEDEVHLRGRLGQFLSVLHSGLLLL